MFENQRNALRQDSGRNQGIVFTWSSFRKALRVALVFLGRDLGSGSGECGGWFFLWKMRESGKGVGRVGGEVGEVGTGRESGRGGGEGGGLKWGQARNQHAHEFVKTTL